MGHYLYDDEGVKARRVTVVDKGILRTFLVDRAPLRDFPRSNGHGRAEPGFLPVSRQSNLIVDSSRTVSRERLLDKLRDEARRQGKPFGLLFDNIEGGFTNTGRGSPNAFNVLPNVVYRIYTDGRAARARARRRSHRHAAGGVRQDRRDRRRDRTSSTACAAPKAAAFRCRPRRRRCSSAKSKCRRRRSRWKRCRFCRRPAGTEVLRTPSLARRRRVLPSGPALSLALSPCGARPVAQDSPRFSAMQDEMRRSMAELRMKGEPAPYYIAYECRPNGRRRAGRLGAIVDDLAGRSRTLRVEVRVGEYTFDSSRFVAQDRGGGDDRASRSLRRSTTTTMRCGGRSG